MDDSRLFSLDTPLAFKMLTTDQEFAVLRNSLSMDHPHAVVRMVRGKKCTTVQDFFNEIGAALQFPYYFGENGAAFNDCITDLEWLPGEAYLILIDNAGYFLSGSSQTELDGIFEIFSDAQRNWLTPNEYIPRNRQATPFHLLIQYAEPDCVLVKRLSELGYPLAELAP
jgi:hypothetical protein